MSLHFTIMTTKKNTSYKIYNKKAKDRKKINLLDEVFPKLPKKKYSIIYADPPWHYNGKMQFDKSGKSNLNKDWHKKIFISAAEFKYPTIKTEELKKLDIQSISEDNSLLFLWTSNPHLEQAIDLGRSWGFEYRTVAFVWNKMAHNPGKYTVSYCELCLLFKRGKIPTPRGARNIKQLINIPRSKHSEKPALVGQNIHKMFPTQKKIELFARNKFKNWDVWGLETIYKNKITSKEEELLDSDQSDLLSLLDR